VNEISQFFLSNSAICPNHAGLIAFHKTTGTDLIFGSKIDSKIM